MATDGLPAAWREAPALHGRHAALEPLHAGHAALEPLHAGHADALRDALAGSGLDRLWHADGTPRDTVAFSIIDTEWPGVRNHLLSRLDAYA
ncbi:hypothetical protein [Coralloluteibacterium thermophilus]|uniref:GNAT family N-acetyltransferase n=1 Tax=Coralloluteibacterium thermophilum TaxID=2707049 RepID=A0ABV9NKL2_9GAMM